MEWGDVVQEALTAVGVTQARITHWLGVPCLCDERREKLNALGRWAKRVAKGQTDKALDYLEQLLT